MKRKKFYDFPELELTEFRSEEGVFASQNTEDVDRDEGDGQPW